jgi:type I restriction enzyme S subunit
MTVDLRPYPIYKESGLPWLGRIPAHWEIGRNGRMFEQRNQNGFSDLPILEVSLKTGVQVRDMGNLKRKQLDRTLKSNLAISLICSAQKAT